MQLLLDELATLRAPPLVVDEGVENGADQALDASSQLPVVLCGDFNMSPHSALYHFVAAGELDASGLSRHHMSGQNAAPGDGIQVWLAMQLLRSVPLPDTVGCCCVDCACSAHFT